MIDPELLAVHFGRSAKLLLKNLAGLSREQSLWRPSPDVNNINWLIGHLIVSRCGMTLVMGLTPVWDEATREPYKNGSGRITGDSEGVLPLEHLIADFTAAHNVLDAGLRMQTVEMMYEPSSNARFATRAEYFLYKQFHETHHVGQVLILRELLGFPSTWPF